MKEISQLNEISSEKQIDIYSDCLKRNNVATGQLPSDSIASACFDEVGAAVDAYKQEMMKYYAYAKDNKGSGYLSGIKKYIKTGDYTFSKALKQAEKDYLDAKNRQEKAAAQEELMQRIMDKNPGIDPIGAYYLSQDYYR